jgi:hypothetical protein
MPDRVTFLGLPTELRVKIYAELLVWKEPIVFQVAYTTTPWSLLRSRERGLYPAILLVSKRTLFEARPLLYCNNRFEIPISIGCSTVFEKEVLPLVPFLDQIGAQARLIRHICIIFPCFRPHRYQPWDQLELGRLHDDYLHLLQAACPGIRTIEFSLLDTSWIAKAYCTLSPGPQVPTVANVADPLAVLDARLKSFTSLRNVIVSAEVYGGSVDDGDAGVGEDGTWKTKMSNYGWTVNIQCPKPLLVSNAAWDLDSKDDFGVYEAGMVIVMEEELRARAWSQAYWGEPHSGLGT